MMASRPISEGASAPSNIVRLPTAAPRKVENRRWKEQRQAAREARRETEDRFDHKSPWHRRVEHDAELLGALTYTPALLVVAAMFREMSDDQQQRIIAQLNRHQHKGQPHEQAALVLEMNRPMMYGRAHDISRAFKRATGKALRISDGEAE